MPRASSFILLLLAAGLVVIYVREPSRKTKMADLIVKRHFTSGEWSSVAADVIPRAVSGTRFQNAWQINGPLDPNRLNVYFLQAGLAARTSLPSGVRQFLGNCSYTGENATIICDDDFLTNFLPARGFGSPPGQKSQKVPLSTTDRTMFLFWVLGHEIGHIVNGDMPAHFGDSSGMSKPVGPAAFSQERELKADQYCARQAVTAQIPIDLQRFLLALINLEIERKVGVVPVAGVGIHWDYTNQRVVRYLRGGTHPEYVVRATRLLIASAEASGDQGIANLAKSFSHHMQQTDEP